MAEAGPNEVRELVDTAYMRGRMSGRPRSALVTRAVNRACYAGRALWLVAALGGVAAHRLVAADVTVAAQGTEYLLTRGMPGDQTQPHLSINANGGYLVWQDNAVDGAGLGIGAAELNGSLSPIPTRMFRVNEITAGDQENPQVQLLKDGGAIFVWQGGKPGAQDIWARVLGPGGTFTSGDLRLNTATGSQHANPAVAVLSDGRVVVLWSSFGQDGSMQGIFGQRLAPNGDKLGGEFQVNQFSSYNQRNPALTAVDGGAFVAAWVSEQQSYENSVEVFARRFDATGAALGDEFRLNSATNLCANPVLAPGWNGGIVAAWSERYLPDLTNMWDVVVGTFDAGGHPVGSPAMINTYRPNNQFAPQIAALGDTRLVVWDSLWEDGSRDGVYGRLLNANGLMGDEFRINTTTVSQQLQPVAAADGASRFLVAWAGFAGGDASFEIFGQRFAGQQVLPAPGAPVVSALDSYSLMVSWAPLAGYSDLAGYRLFVDGAATPVVLTNNFYILTDLDPATTHSFRLAYELTGSQVSPLSEPATGMTWGRDRNHDGLPDDWQILYWGADSSTWPAPSADADGDGASNLAEFLAGTDPSNAESALRVSIAPTTGGLLVQWNALPGSIYQLQTSGDLKSWSDAAGPAFAPGSVASSVIPGTNSTAYYRVIRVR